MRQLAFVLTSLALVSAPQRAVAQCSTAHLSQALLGGGVSTPVADDTSFHNSSIGLTPASTAYVAKGTNLYAINNLTGATVWGPISFGTSLLQSAITPVPLSAGAPHRLMLFLAGADGVVYGYDATNGSQVWFNNTIVSYTATACPKERVSGVDTVTAEPIVQIYDFSNSAFQTAMQAWSTSKGKTIRDLVFVITRIGCSLGYNKIYALDARDGQAVWTFNNAFTQNVNAGFDSCYVLYDPTSSAPPFNNTLFCGTDQTGPTQNSLWALNTTSRNGSNVLIATGVKAWALPFGVPAGPIGVRVHVRPDRGNIYYGTLDNAIRVKHISDGSDVYSAYALASAITRPVWSEFRNPVPGVTDMIQLVTADGVYRRVMEDTMMGTLSEAVSTTASSGTFDTQPVMFPSEGKAYIGTTAGTIQQIDASLGPSSPLAYATMSGGSAFTPSLDFNDYDGTLTGMASSDIDRLSATSSSGTLDRFCVPWGSGSMPWSSPGISSLPPGGPPAPVPWTTGCGAPDGLCGCDQDCIDADYGGFLTNRSKCHSPICVIRNTDRFGTCVLAKAPNFTHCDNGNNNDCSPEFASCANCSTGLCDICIDAVCLGANRIAQACNNIGDQACAAGQSCCGVDGCIDLAAGRLTTVGPNGIPQVIDCGACGNKCDLRDSCVNGTCTRPSCTTPSDTELKNRALSGELKGGNAIAAFRPKPSECHLLVGQLPVAPGQGRGQSADVPPGAAAANIILSATSIAPTNGVEAMQNGQFFFENTWDIDNKRLEFSRPTDPAFTVAVTSNPGAQGITVPFQQTAYDNGFAANPALNLKGLVLSNRIWNYLGNYGQRVGEIDVVVNTVTTPSVNLLTSFTPPIQALAFVWRANGDGVVVSGITQSTANVQINVTCQQALTSNGQLCKEPSFFFNIADPSIFPNQDPKAAVLGQQYIPSNELDRVYAIASDPVSHDWYIEIGSTKNVSSEVVRVRDENLFGTTGNQKFTIQNVVDVQEENGLTANSTLKPVYFNAQAGGRLTVTQSGVLIRIVPPSAIGGNPQFFQGMVP